MTDGTSAAITSEDRLATQNRVSNIIDLMSELQLWSLRDENTSSWAMDALTQERKWQINHAGKNCGIWDAVYLSLAAPVIFAVIHGVLRPFDEAPNPITWAILLFVLFAYPVTNMVYSLRGLKRVKGPLTRRILSTFMFARAMTVISITFAMAYIYGWGLFRIDLTTKFTHLQPEAANTMRTIFRYLFDMLAQSVDLLVPLSLFCALMPLVLLWVQRTKAIRKEEIIEDLRIQ